MPHLRIFTLLLAAMLAFSGCSDNSTEPQTTDDPTESMVLIGEDSAQNTRISVYAPEQPAVGYNRIYVRMTNTTNNTVVNNGSIAITPMMNMGQMQHSAPFEDPAGGAAVDGLYPCAVNFIMAGMWELHVNFQNQANNDAGEIMLNFDVAPSSMVKSATGADARLYFVTLLQPAVPTVGLNDFEITVHYRENMNAFPAITDAAVEMTPSMPSMGHGSPNNVNPVHGEMGHYRGKVNFTMSGDWRIDLSLSRGDSLLTTAFDINVP